MDESCRHNRPTNVHVSGKGKISIKFVRLKMISDEYRFGNKGRNQGE